MRLIIADDEPHMQNRLSTKIDWSCLGVDELIVCADGDMALQFIEKQPVDILLTDIKMARMDGITLSRKALLINPALKIIMMSAYDDKAYLKSAIGLHVIDYLEKPFSLESVEQAVEKAIEEIASFQIQDAGGSVQSLLRLSQLVLSLCQPPDDPQQLRDLVRKLAPNLEDHRFYCTLLVKYTLDPFDADGQITAVNYPNVYQLFDGMSRAGIVSMTKDNRMVCHIGYDQPSDRESMADDLKEKISELLPDCLVIVAAGRPVASCALLHQSFSEAEMAMEQHFFNERPIQFYHESSGSICHLDQSALALFRNALQGRDQAACYASVDSLFNSIVHHEATQVRDIKNYYFQLIQIIVGEVTELKAYASDSSKYYIWEIIFFLDTLRKLNDYTLELLDASFENSQARNSRMEIIAKIRSYIHAHAADPGLSLQAISKAHFMSVPYMCTCFKEMTGTTIKTCLTEYRMAKARDLLLHTDLKIAEIAEKTGYSDQNYFTKRFVKHFGMPPSKFKEQNT